MIAGGAVCAKINIPSSKIPKTKPVFKKLTIFKFFTLNSIEKKFVLDWIH